VLVDRFLERAVEVDCDAVFDGDELFVGGILEHIEEAGIHSGDSACVLPPLTLGEDEMEKIKSYTETLARALGVRGLINVQYALKDERIFVLEANPRASRTVPFISKATGVPLAKVASRVMAGASLHELREESLLPTRLCGHDGLRHVAVKAAVLPFDRFPGVDSVLGPEMRSTGEVMGIDDNFGLAYAKAQLGAGLKLPVKGSVFISVANPDKRAVIFPAKRLADLGFELLATAGTARVLERAGVAVTVVPRVSGPHDGKADACQRIRRGEIELVFNTPFGRRARTDGYYLRTAATESGVPTVTTMAGMSAAVQGIESLLRDHASARPLQEYLDPLPEASREAG
jgi:carbamoyl-phosphate synthase large subunit